jgi:hypothetical protein
MQTPQLPSIVYHGTDVRSGESIKQFGLDEMAWRAAGGPDGVDEKGLSVTSKRAIAELWARDRATDRGGPSQGIVLEADAENLPLRTGGPGVWTDPHEFFISPEDFGGVGPGVFR